MTEISDQALVAVTTMKHDTSNKLGWGPELRKKMGYFTPDDQYEGLLYSLVKDETDWLDVGCGRDIFPSNYRCAKYLSDKCNILVGVDPSGNIWENDLVHEKHQSDMESFCTDRKFDLITLRMVAEHVANPDAFVQKLAELAKPNGEVGLYTVYKWAPSSIAAALTPLSTHHKIKKILWGTEEKDTFPTKYKMNTRRVLREVFSKNGFLETQWIRLDDCRMFGSYKALNSFELYLWKFLKKFGIPYPEYCIAGVYKKNK